MFFYADRNVKDNLLQMYKQDAKDHMQRKNDLRTRRINEEKEYLDNIHRREQLEEDKRRQEKQRRVHETMNEYNEMVSHLPDGRIRKGKFEDVRINTYGVSLGSNNNHSQSLSNQLNQQNNNSNNFENQNLAKSVTVATPSSKGENHKSNFQTASPYDDNYIRMQKLDQQRMYKSYLDSQMSQKNSIKNPQFRQNIITGPGSYTNPYNPKNNEIGDTCLNHNPITNPVIDFKYNKYLTNSLKATPFQGNPYLSGSMQSNNNGNGNNFSRGGEVNMNVNQNNNYGNNNLGNPMQISMNQIQNQNNQHSYSENTGNINSNNNYGPPMNYNSYETGNSFQNFQPTQNLSGASEQNNIQRDQNINYNSYPYPPINMNSISTNIKNEHNNNEEPPSHLVQSSGNNFNPVNGNLNSNYNYNNSYNNKGWTPSGEKLRMAANNILR